MTPSEDRVLNKLREEIAELVANAVNAALMRTLATVRVCASDDIPFAASGEILAAWNRRADPLVEELRGALEPFATWAADNVASEEDGGYIWDGHGCQRERIRDWFGPSDFGRAREALALPVVAGSSREPAQATQVSSDPTANADEPMVDGLAALGREIANRTPKIDMADVLSVVAPLPHPDTSRHVDGAGWVLVPREPTEEMCAAFLEAEEASPMLDPLGAFEDAYAAMLAHVGEPPAALAQPDSLTETSGDQSNDR